MELPLLRMSFVDRAELTREHDQNLSRGRAFLNQSSDVPVLSQCVLVLIHPEHGRELQLQAQVVMVNKTGPMCGVGLALTGLSDEEQARLAAFAAAETPAENTNEVAAPAQSDAPAPANDIEKTERANAVTLQPSAADDTAEVLLIPNHPVGAEHTRPDANTAVTLIPAPDSPTSEELAAAAELARDADGLDFPRNQEEELGYSEPPPERESGRSARRPNTGEIQAENRQQRLRSLNAAEQLKVARTGELTDRTFVERLYGKHVWDALLHNPRLTIPEVARIARKGTVPKPLLELILENPAWVKADAVRRALLSNPKVSSEAVVKLLRATPKAELKLIEKGTAYATSVRDAARKLLRQ
ncbi:MAG: hypothetical protein RL701_5887 [Pseudomonadota bacterium]